MNKVEISTPGKLMLFGEHAVVYGRPCIVTAVDQRIKVAIEEMGNQSVILNAPEVQIENLDLKLKNNDLNQIPKGAKFIAAALNNFCAEYHLEKGLKIVTKSDFSSKFGFGSSSAVTVGVIKGLAEIKKVKLSNKQLFELAYKSVLDVQGVGSGFDLAAAIWGGTLYFVTGGKQIKPLRVNNLPLVVGYTGIKADTATWVRFVAERKVKFPVLVNDIFDTMEKLVELARKALENEDWDSLGELMDINQGLLESLGVSTLKLTELIHTSRLSGAWGSKLSGAGGGDCMLALTDKAKTVEKAIIEKGGQIIYAKTNAQGARME